MQNWAITGASGSVSQALIKFLVQKGQFEISAFSRNKIDSVAPSCKLFQVDSYESVVFDNQNFDGLLVTQGSFEYREFVDLSSEEIMESLKANLLSQIMTVRSYLQNCRFDKPNKIILLGSTNAYDSGKGTVLYGVAKSALLTFVKALNNEYKESEIKFTLFSTGTINNPMGLKVPNQDVTSLLDLNLIVKRLYEIMIDESTAFEPEVVIRRRHIR
jgi:short-subunit dehydrogenase